MKTIKISLLALILLSSLTSEAMACKDKHGHHKGKFFSFIDANNDEKITSAEMTDHAVKIFKEHDTNNDGVITLNDVKNDVATKFTKIDKNKDGFVNKDELKDHFKNKHKDHCKKCESCKTKTK